MLSAKNVSLILALAVGIGSDLATAADLKNSLQEHLAKIAKEVGAHPDVRSSALVDEVVAASKIFVNGTSIQELLRQKDPKMPSNNNCHYNMEQSADGSLCVTRRVSYSVPLQAVQGKGMPPFEYVKAMLVRSSFIPHDNTDFADFTGYRMNDRNREQCTGTPLPVTTKINRDQVLKDVKSEPLFFDTELLKQCLQTAFSKTWSCVLNRHTILKTGSKEAVIVRTTMNPAQTQGKCEAYTSFASSGTGFIYASETASAINVYAIDRSCTDLEKFSASEQESVRGDIRSAVQWQGRVIKLSCTDSDSVHKLLRAALGSELIAPSDTTSEAPFSVPSQSFRAY